MTKNEKYISQPLAKKIYDKAKEIGFELPESEKYWSVVKDNFDIPAEIVNYCGKNRRGKYSDGTKWSEKFYNAYDIAELVNMLTELNINDKIEIQDINPNYLANKLILFYAER